MEHFCRSLFFSQSPLEINVFFSGSLAREGPLASQPRAKDFRTPENFSFVGLGTPSASQARAGNKKRWYCHSEIEAKGASKCAESKATQAKPEADSKTARAAPNRWQRITKKVTPCFTGCVRTSSWQASKAIQAKRIEALFNSLSKIMREGHTVYMWLMWLLNIVQVPMKRFCMHFHQDESKKFPWRKSFLDSKKTTQDVSKNKNAGCWGENYCKNWKKT